MTYLSAYKTSPAGRIIDLDRAMLPDVEVIKLFESIENVFKSTTYTHRIFVQDTSHSTDGKTTTQTVFVHDPWSSDKNKRWENDFKLKIRPLYKTIRRKERWIHQMNEKRHTRFLTKLIRKATTRVKMCHAQRKRFEEYYRIRVNALWDLENLDQVSFVSAGSRMT